MRKTFRWFEKLVNGKTINLFVDYAEQNEKITELAIASAISKIADTIAKNGFQVIGQQSEAVDYMLNVKANRNQNATDFWKQAIERMLYKPEGCLIIHIEGRGLFIAENWEKDDSVMQSIMYKNVEITVDGNTMKLNRTFRSEDVVHLRYTNPRILALLKQCNKMLEEAYNAALYGFNAKMPKFKVKMQGATTLRDKTTGKAVDSNQYAERVAKTLAANKVKAIVASSGIDVETIESKNAMSADDIEKLKDNIFSNTASAFNIPKSLIYGSPTKEEMNAFFTFACDPIIAIINNAMTGAFVYEHEYASGVRIRVNDLCVRHIDVIDNAVNLDKLYQNGWSHNDIMRLIGQPAVTEEWADTRRFTKNYSEEVEA